MEPTCSLGEEHSALSRVSRWKEHVKATDLYLEACVPCQGGRHDFKDSSRRSRLPSDMQDAVSKSQVRKNL